MFLRLRLNVEPFRMSDALRSDDVCRDITDDYCCSCVCDECGERYRDWAQHVRRSPDCVPPELVENSSEDEDEEPLPPPLRHADEEKQSGFSSRPSVELAARIALDLATFRNEFGLSGPNVKLLKEKVQGWFDHDRSELCGGLQHFLREGISSNDIKQAAERDIFAGLSSEKQEIARVKEIAPYVEPREVKLSYEQGDTVVSFRVADLVEHAREAQQRGPEVELERERRLVRRPRAAGVAGALREPADLVQRPRVARVARQRGVREGLGLLDVAGELREARERALGLEGAERIDAARLQEELGRVPVTARVEGHEARRELGVEPAAGERCVLTLREHGRRLGAGR